MNDSSRRHHIIFQPEGVECDVPKGQSLFESAREQGIALRSDCGGKGLCGKCRVVVNPGDSLSVQTEAEIRHLDATEPGENWRLACQARVFGQVTVNIPAERTDQGQIDKGVEQSIFPLDPRVVFHDQRGVTAVLRGKRERSLGVALDVGTTSLAAYLCDLGSGKVLASAAALNPQRVYGEDVISRITFANQHPSGTDVLHRLVIEEANVLIGRCLKTTEASIDDVDEMTVVGNTTMQHLFMGLHPYSLGVAPYVPITCSAHDIRAGDLGLGLNPCANVHIFPAVSGFLGGDTVAAILAVRPHQRQEITLILDIGTNGELVMGSNQSIWATSCATGPAFEGAHISCGMRAVSGAIHKVRISPRDWTVAYEIINGGVSGPPQGLCGSAVVDAVAEMRRADLLNENGRIREGMPGVIMDEEGIGQKFLLVPASKTATGRDISLTLSDIRQIQLAKAALSSGITLLMRRKAIGRINRLVLTGSFGVRMDWLNVRAIGMIPDSLEVDQVVLVENAAGIGAIQALLNKGMRQEAQYLASTVETIEMADDTDFATEFVQAMSFPALS